MKSARDPREDRSLEGADTGAHAGGDYLWDKTGRDAEVEQLESLLGGFRHAGAPLEPRRRPSYYPPPIWGAVTAIAAVLVAILMIVVRSGGTKTSLPLDAYAVLHDAGGKDAPSVLRSGDELVFASRARVQIGALGEVEVEPDSRLRVERIEERRHRLYLAEGRVRATIDAEPRVFQIGTPAGDAVDLGCAYELTVDEDGSAEVRVTEGEVSFELDGREVYVPAGASCRSTPGDGPRAPFFDAVDAAFRAAVEAVELASEPSAAAIDQALQMEDRSYGLTVWHLFTSEAASAELRQAAFQRLQALFPLPPGVQAQGVLDGDPQMRRAWFESMQRWWR